jgi:polynucleotide 5'-hydroxyl-kinase GRC3/NOL9
MVVDGREVVVDRVVEGGTVVVLLGGLDTGKTTLGRAIAAKALEVGRTVGYLDADLGQKAVGPPTTVSLRVLRTPEDLRPEAMAASDALYFVGSTTPQGQLLPLVVGAGRLLDRSVELGADLVIVDTSGTVSGVYGQLLKYHKLEQLQPDIVIGLQRGEELEPILGIVSRFFSAEVVVLPVDPEVLPLSVEERARGREQALASYFTPPLQRWRVKPTVFMPTLPALFEQSELDHLLVGLSDGEGTYTGLGFLEYSRDDGVLRLTSPVPEAPKALRLGSVRVDDGFRLRKVDLRNLFGTD